MLEVVRLASPMEGGSVGAMCSPVFAALGMARLIGPSAVERVHVSVAGWRGPPPVKSTGADRELDTLLER